MRNTARLGATNEIRNKTPIPAPAVGYSGAVFFVAGFGVLWRVLGMTWADFIAMAGVSIVVYLVTKWGARRGFKAYDPRNDEERRRLLR